MQIETYAGKNNSGNSSAGRGLC
ncbi:protein of unknown function [Streptomyces sp. KY75]|nr:protein of unknown function [Streptomyces sp. KY75]CAD5990107.1 protein of unknown function [Streptomyces sp. KY70]